MKPCIMHNLFSHSAIIVHFWSKINCVSKICALLKGRKISFVIHNSIKEELITDKELL